MEKVKVIIPYEVNAEKIRMERARLNLSKNQVAEKIGETRFVISSIENEKYKTVKMSILEKLAKLYDLKAEELLKKEKR